MRALARGARQAEERTLWEARDVYLAMSPLLHADKCVCACVCVRARA